MSAVVEWVEERFEDTVDFVGDVGEVVVEAAEDVVTVVADTVVNTVQAAVDDPVGTIVRVGTAIYAPYLLPVVSAGVVVANGGSVEQALVSAAVSYAAPAIAEGLGDQLVGTWVGDALSTAAEATGIESLPQAFSSGVTSTGIQTGIGLSQGQDFDDALTRGLTAGVGTLVGRTIAGEADTGYDTVDKLLGGAAGAATTAGLRGNDAEQAVSNALTNSLINGAINYGGNQLRDIVNSDQVPTDEEVKVADNTYDTIEPIPEEVKIAGVAGSDAELTPTESAVAQLKKPVEFNPNDQSTVDALVSSLYPSVTIEGANYTPDSRYAPGGEFNPNPENPEDINPSVDIDQESTIPEITPEEFIQQNIDQESTIPEITPAETIQQNIDQDIQFKADESGTISDALGNEIGNAAELGLILGSDASGKPVYMTPNGDFIPIVDTPSVATKLPSLDSILSSNPTIGSSDITTSGTGSLINNESLGGAGSLINSESSGGAGFLTGNDIFDFPQEIINNPDGSTTIIESDGTNRVFNIDGTVSITSKEGEIVSETQEGYDGVNGVDYNKEGEGYDGVNGVDYSLKPEETLEKDTELGKLAKSLLPTPASTSTPTSNKNTNYRNALYLSALGGIGASMLNNSDSQSNVTPSQGLNFAYNPYNVQGVEQARAYGQPFFNPTYTQDYAEGGLLSLTPPSYMQPQMSYGQLNNQQNSQQFNNMQQNNAMPQQNQMMQPQNNSSLFNQQFAQPQNYATNQPMNYNNQDPSNSVQMFARGGISSLGGYSDGGRMLKGPGDGMSDSIPATIANKQPARLANEEFVIPADVVSHLGNGSSEAGAKVLYAMMDRVRQARTGNPKQGKQIQPAKYMPKVRK